MWEALYLLINEPSTILTGNARTLLIPANNFIIKTMEKSNETKVFMRSLVGILCLLVKDNEAFTKQIIELVRDILTKKNVVD